MGIEVTICRGTASGETTTVKTTVERLEQLRRENPDATDAAIFRLAAKEQGGQ